MLEVKHLPMEAEEAHARLRKSKGSRSDKQEGADVFRLMMPQFHNTGSKQSAPGGKETAVLLSMAQSLL